MIYHHHYHPSSSSNIIIIQCHHHHNSSSPTIIIYHHHPSSSSSSSSSSISLNIIHRTGIFPEKWKIAKVVPIHKKGSLQDGGNFRPISTLSTLSKLPEKHVHNAFYSYLKFQNLVHLAQSGFRNLFSGESALLNNLNKWTTAIDNDDNMNGVILLDLRKAFDLIDLDILNQKLRMYNALT